MLQFSIILRFIYTVRMGVNAEKSTSCYRMEYISNYGHEKKKFTPQFEGVEIDGYIV